MYSRWTTIDEDGNFKDIEVKEPTYNPALEEYTDYEFTQEQKDKAKNPFVKVDEFFQDIGAGLSNGAKVMKYVPYLALIAGTVFIYKKAQA